MKKMIMVTALFAFLLTTGCGTNINKQDGLALAAVGTVLAGAAYVQHKEQEEQAAAEAAAAAEEAERERLAAEERARREAEQAERDRLAAEAWEREQAEREAREAEERRAVELEKPYREAASTIAIVDICVAENYLSKTDQKLLNDMAIQDVKKTLGEQYDSAKMDAQYKETSFLMMAAMMDPNSSYAMYEACTGMQQLAKMTRAAESFEQPDVRF